MENLEKTILEKIKLVRQSLKEKDFSKASVYCKEIINRDPENAEAYLDLFYAENEVVNHKEYEDKKLAQTAEAELTKHEIFLPQEELDNLRNYGEYNSFDTSILDRPHAIEYFTETESREAQLAEVQEYLENNENLQKAIQFTKRGEAASINLMKMILFREMQKRIDQAKEQDALAAEQAQEQIPFKKREIMNAMMEGGMVDSPAYSEPAEAEVTETGAEESTDDSANESAATETAASSETEAEGDSGLLAEDGEETLFTGTLPDDGYDTVDAKTAETAEDNKDMVTDYEIEPDSTDDDEEDDDEDEDEEDEEDDDEDDDDDDESEESLSEEDEIGEDGVPIMPAPPKEFVKLPEIEENYQEACSLLKTGRAGLRKIYKNFEALGDYKDSKEKLEEVKGLMMDRKRHLAGLKDEKRDIMSTFPKLNAFQAKKKKELEARLIQINQEIDDLTVETDGYPVFDENM